MTRKVKIFTALSAALLAAAGAGIAIAQSASLVSSAMAEGSVGEQADGYLGFRTTPSSALRAEVDAINIKRRAAYTGLAAQRGVTIKDVAATVGCETLDKRVAQGRAYKLADDVWRVKGSGDIQLPSYCAS
jgi:uncharacterized protein